MFGSYFLKTVLKNSLCYIKIILLFDFSVFYIFYVFRNNKKLEIKHVFFLFLLFF